MCRRLKLLEFLFVANLLFLLPLQAQSQQFVDGMKLFNKAQYDSLIQHFVPQFIKENPDEEGVARYFLAESYYNKGIGESQAGLAAKYFERAYSEFSKALKSSDLRSSYEEYSHSSLYKMGWSSYRLAELNSRPLVMLDRAYKHFAGVESGAPDSLQLAAFYMAGKCAIRLSLLQIYNQAGSALDSTAVVKAAKSFIEVDEFYKRILSYEGGISAPRNLEPLKVAAQIEKQALHYVKGKWYQVLSMNPGRSLGRNRSDDRQRSLSYFAGVLEGGQTSTVLPKETGAMVSYLTLLAALDNYLMSGNETARSDFIVAWDNLIASDFETEKTFRRGILHHGHPNVTSDDFNELASRYYEAAGDIPESRYWLGYIQMIQGDTRHSLENLQQFLSSKEKDNLITAREQVLFEDGQFRKYLLEFESLYLSNRFSRLRTLADEIQAFAPESREIQSRKELLNLLVNCSLTRNTSQLWTEVLHGSDEEKIKQALSTITFILPRAALSIGMTREKYLTLLDRLFDITKGRKTDETLFFRGIAKTLEAEIQANPRDKSKTYKEAAKILGSIRSDYASKDEAEYLRAKCLFFADEFDEAETLLRQLVSTKGSLRALFYLAEVYRYNGQGLAAKECYRVITGKLADAKEEFDRYWLLNAKAGLEASNDEGDLKPLDKIKIADVEFQPNIHPDQLAYEKLADERFLQQLAARESVQWLMRYGLPKREIYPSTNRLNNSMFVAANIFENYPGVIDEVRGPVTSTFKLTLMAPNGVESETEVWLDTERLNAAQGVYLRKALQLNSEHELVIKNAQCYTYEGKVRLEKAGENVRVVLLNKKIALSASGRIQNVSDNVQNRFAPRWDRNFVFTTALAALPSNSELDRDFETRYELRDLAVDGAGNRILAVDAGQNEVLMYSYETGAKVGSLDIGEISLKSPEGITVDARGRIFVADWGNHRIVQLTSSGEYIASLGTFGTNDSVEGSTLRLTFPTRVAVLEDTEGVVYEGNKYYRDSYLFVADQNGVHICSMDGQYLDTVISPHPDFMRGDFYALRVAGYNDETVIDLINRKSPSSGQIRTFEAK